MSMTPRTKRPLRRLPAWDIGFALLMAAAILIIGHRIATRFTYHWQWPAIFQYLLRFDDQLGRWVPNLLLQGLMTTIRLSLWGCLLAVLIGVAMGMFRISRSLFKRLVAGSYVELGRNLPPLVIILIFYYFLSDQIIPLIGVDRWARSLSPVCQTWVTFWLAPVPALPAFVSAVITLAVFEGAYITEIVRAGIESIEKGQWEAAQSIGMSRRQCLRHIIWPQALRRILPPLAGQFISTIKDSAIVSVISIQELTFQGMELMAATYLTIEVWITITVLYLALTLTCSLALERLESRLNRHRKT